VVRLLPGTGTFAWAWGARARDEKVEDLTVADLSFDINSPETDCKPRTTATEGCVLVAFWSFERVRFERVGFTYGGVWALVGNGPSAASR